VPELVAHAVIIGVSIRLLYPMMVRLVGGFSLGSAVP
jgi:hypothetical protein